MASKKEGKHQVKHEGQHEGKSKTGKRMKDVEAQDSESSDVSVDKDHTKHKQTKSVTHRKIAGGHVTTTVVTNESEREALAQSSASGKQGGGVGGCFGLAGGRNGRWALYGHPVGIIFVAIAGVTSLISIIVGCYLLFVLISTDPRTQSRPDLHRVCQHTAGHEHFICDEKKIGCYSPTFNYELRQLCPGEIPINPLQPPDTTKCFRACGMYHSKFEPMFSIGYAVCFFHIVGGLAAMVLIFMPCTSILGLIVGILVYGIAALGTIAMLIVIEGQTILTGLQGAIEIIYDPDPKHYSDGKQGHFAEISADRDYLRSYQKKLGLIHPAILLELVTCSVTVVILLAMLVFFCVRINNRII